MRLQKLRLWPLHGPISRQLLVFTTLEGGEIKFSSWLAALVRPSSVANQQAEKWRRSTWCFFLLVSQIWFDLKGWYRYWASPLARDLLGYREWERRASLYGEADAAVLVRWLLRLCCWRGRKKLPFSSEKLCVEVGAGGLHRHRTLPASRVDMTVRKKFFFARWFFFSKVLKIYDILHTMWNKAVVSSLWK